MLINNQHISEDSELERTDLIILNNITNVTPYAVITDNLCESMYLDSPLRTSKTPIEIDACAEFFNLPTSSANRMQCNLTRMLVTSDSSVAIFRMIARRHVADLWN